MPKFIEALDEREREVISDMLNAYAEMVNIAESLDSEELVKIGSRVVDDYKIDEKSREDWKKRTQNAIDLASQIAEGKTWAGGKVSEVKYPAISTAAIQFAARAYPNIIKDQSVVKPKVIGNDDDGTKLTRGNRIARHMSYQFLEEMEDWEEQLDQLLVSLPVVGCQFKKTYRSATEGNVSELVSIFDVCININAKSVKKPPG